MLASVSNRHTHMRNTSLIETGCHILLWMSFLRVTLCTVKPYTWAVWSGVWFLCPKTFRPAFGTNQPPVHWVPVVLFLEAKWLGHKFDHLSLCSVEDENEWSYISFHDIVEHWLLYELPIIQTTTGIEKLPCTFQ